VKYEREVRRACQRRCIFNNRRSESKGSISSLVPICSAKIAGARSRFLRIVTRRMSSESISTILRTILCDTAKVAFRSARDQRSSRRADPFPLYRRLLLGDSGKLDAFKPCRFKYTKTNEEKRNCAHGRASVSREGGTETDASDVELMNAGFVPATGIDSRKFVSWAGILSYPASHA